MIKSLAMMLSVGLVATHAWADETTKKKQEQKVEKKSAVVKTSKDNVYVAPSTDINFEETLIDGKMKAPSGFMLHGRKGQRLDQMVELRKDFARKLKHSKAAVKAITPSAP